jgi:hypothetical protein
MGRAGIARRPLRRRLALWVAGLPALLLAWLVPFVSLLNASSTIEGRRGRPSWAPRPRRSLGVLASDWLINRGEAGTGRRPLVSWLLGVAALVPAWLVALILAARIER